MSGLSPSDKPQSQCPTCGTICTTHEKDGVFDTTTVYTPVSSTAATVDGPLGGFATVGREATELDFLLTQLQVWIEEKEDEEGLHDERIHAANQALELKRQIIDRFARSATGTPALGLTDSEVIALAKVLNNSGRGLIDQCAAIHFYKELCAMFSPTAPSKKPPTIHNNHGWPGACADVTSCDAIRWKAIDGNFRWVYLEEVMAPTDGRVAT